MPVRFKGSSEYKENFKPFTMQPVTAAPGSQVTEGMTVEPPIQHKKRIEGPPTSMTCDFYERPPPQEYTLLGQNDKFASNVRYVPKKKLVMDNVNRSVENSKFIQPDPNEPIKNLDTYNIEKLNLKQVNKAPSPKKAPKVDTSKFVDPPTPLTPRIPKRQAETKQTQTPFNPEVKDVNAQVKVQSNGKKTTGQGLPKTSQNGDMQAQSRAVQANLDVSASKKRHSPAKKQVNARLVEEKRAQAEKEEVYKAALKDKNLKDVLDQQPRKEKWNERVQTNVDKGILNAVPEATSDYAMRYKAGIAGARKGRKWSEYQREFEWKNRVPDSPLLAADQVVHKSSTTLAAPKSAPKPRASEYKSQFKTWKMKPVERKDKVERQEEPEAKKAKLKRSKSMGAIADNARNEREDDVKGRQPVRKSLKDKSEIAAVVSSSHGKLRRTESEYHSNFRAPSQFVYKDGAWHGANHPHAYFSKDPKDMKMSKNEEASNWYLEVLELRQKAEEYRKRAQGTHFSRAHLAQLLARQAEMWDNDTRSTSQCSTISALSLETGDNVQTNKPGYKEKPVKKQRYGRVEKGKQLNDNSSVRAVSPSTTDYEEQRSEISGENVYLAGGDNLYGVKKGTGYPRAKGGNGYPKVKGDKGYRSRGEESYNNNAARHNIRPIRRTAWSNTPTEDTLTEDGYSGRDDMSTPVNEEEEYYRNNNYQEGRLPTPQLQQLNKPVQRHHFDLTTPCVGGAILSSPPPTNSRPMKKYLPKETTRMQLYHNDLSDDEEEEARLIGKTYNLNKMIPKTTYGLPSHDTHYLLDEDASTDRPMRTQFIHTPVPSQSDESEIDGEPNYVSSPKKKQSPAPPMPAINENFGQTYVKPAIIPIHSYDVEKEYYEDDDDALSISVRSVASSCSLASEILERSKHRSNNFWKTRSVAAQ